MCVVMCAVICVVLAGLRGDGTVWCGIVMCVVSAGLQR